MVFAREGLCVSVVAVLKIEGTTGGYMTKLMEKEVEKSFWKNKWKNRFGKILFSQLKRGITLE